MTKQISFIHAADLHLDSPFKGLTDLPEDLFHKVRESTFLALDRLVKAAIDKKVDFVLMVGDLFDNEKQSLKAQIYLRRAFEELKQHRINVYLSYGNHDYIIGNVYPVTYPDNVFVFPDEQVTHFTYKKDGQPIANIYGFSYENRAVLENKANEYERKDSDVPFHIAMLHGSVGSNTEHDTYAPFQISDLAGAPFHYWALGHIHKREILKGNPPIVYSGNIQGRNRKETGEKGCYHVVLSEADVNMTFIPLQEIQFTSLEVDASGCKEIHELEKQIVSSLNGFDQRSHLLIDLLLIGDNQLLRQWDSEKRIEDLIEIINETAEQEALWKYIYRVKNRYDEDIKEHQLFKGEHFVGELVRHFDQTSIHSHLEELYYHRSARKFLSSLSGEEEQLIVSEAKELLMRELWKG
ncbi:DNA repair exonuclease [Oceanobacillus piezotolerans]|uniref:DNA repair exonuclease n=1 Tax=Oceanobacillus piezotolerans TaxID=2448030 RepID=A0A498D8Q3_9BACI|nr:DNA repair exonuclease [Oceanobacillus piezotolerans]